ncbi:transglycosylase SLT domain-containing protein [Caldimonas sp. KR1-144]|uniref:transglycosylase SLT domain-containing protein n=1 Tax=Caldimonas sp. KR1-144 TaxID=3400911 RepID=UPI003C0DB070
MTLNPPLRLSLRLRRLPHLLAAALGLWFAGCASVPSEPAAAPLEAAASAPETPASAPDVAVVATAPAASAPENNEAAEAAGAPTDPLRPDTPVALDDESARRDLWVRVRRGFTMPDIDTELVEKHARWYASRPDYVQRMTERSSRYLYHIVDELERRGMPSELALLPFVESAFNPQAMSVAKASGMWQFMPATGRDYELHQNIFRDDRRDILASTRAALDYLQRLYGMFGDWHLALAAYNWGEGNVQRAIARNQRAGLPTDYLNLRMPAETANYVPKLQAVKNIVAQPQSFGLELPPIENHPYFLSVPIQRDIDAQLVANLAGLPLDEFKALNPSLNKPVILAAGTPQVLLPYDNANRFVRVLPEHKGPLASWTAWVVPRTMKPSEAAKQVGMSEAQLREINRIPPRMLVKAGSTLLVPRNGHRDRDVAEHVADNAMLALAPERAPGRRVVVAAKPRDTLSSIAKRHGVSLASLAQWNNLSPNASIGRGQRIVLYLPAKAQAAKAGKTAKPAAGARKTARTRAGRKTASR